MWSVGCVVDAGIMLAGMRILEKIIIRFIFKNTVSVIDGLESSSNDNTPDYFQGDPYRVILPHIKDEAVVEVCAPKLVSPWR